MQFPERLALNSGQLDGGAITAMETFVWNHHLLTFKFGRNAAHIDIDVGILRICHKFVVVNLVDDTQVEVDLSIIHGICPIDLDVVILAFLHGDGCTVRTRSMIGAELLDGVTVDKIDALSTDEAIEHDILRLVGMERCCILRREIAEVYTRSEYCCTARTELPRRSEVLHNYGFSLTTWVVPIFGCETTLPVQACALAECALEDITCHEVRTTLIDNVRFTKGLLHSVEHSDRTTWRTIVIAPLSHTVGGIGTNHGNLRPLLQGQQIPIVLKKHHRLASHP